MGVEGVQVLSPSSLSSSPNSPPSLSKCHAFSIERLVNNDYHPRRIYSDLAVATSPMTHTPTPPTTYFAAVNVLYPERRPQSTLPPKKRHHLSTRYLFTRRLTCTHPDNSPTNCFVEKCQTEDKSRCEKSSLFTPLNKLKNGRRNGIPKRNLVMVSSKRLVPTLYQCKVCDIVFENQVEMGDHFNRVRHEQWTPGPQRPLTLLARGTDARYVPILWISRWDCQNLFQTFCLYSCQQKILFLRKFEGSCMETHLTVNVRVNFCPWHQFSDECCFSLSFGRGVLGLSFCAFSSSAQAVCSWHPVFKEVECLHKLNRSDLAEN